MRATLVNWSWLWRDLLVELPERTFHIVYSGRGLGYETVYVNDWIADRVSSPLWFAPLFLFPLGRHLGVVEVRVWPWLTIQSFHLIVDGEVLYSEGSRLPQHLPPSWGNSVCRRWEATGKVSAEATGKLSSLVKPGDGKRGIAPS